MLTILAMFIIIISLLIVMNKVKKYNKSNYNSNISKITHVKTPLGNFDISNKESETSSNTSDSKEKFIDKLPDDIKEKVLKGDVKITDNVNRKVIKYQNGEKVSEEETNSSNIIDKKAIQKCPNCGASIDMNLDECVYCRTKIN